MEKFIDCSQAAREKLMSVFRTTKATVSLALRFKLNSDNGKKIRHAAVTQYGGKIKLILSIEETQHRHDGVMVQLFSNGAVLTLNTKTGVAQIENKQGELVRKEHISTFNDLETMQFKAAIL